MSSIYFMYSSHYQHVSLLPRCRIHSDSSTLLNHKTYYRCSLNQLSAFSVELLWTKCKLPQ